MAISKTYEPKAIEEKWYQYWLDHKFFHSEPDEREPYTIVIPPPNVTGVLHMGHMLNNTIQDILIRKARMEGKNACWVPGTDHASIATEAKVVAMLKEQGIAKKDLSRDEFLKYCWEWTEKYGGIILHQLKKLGCSCDWDRTDFTMNPAYYKAVTDVFVDLYHKGYIYRGARMINWDPAGKTALSDEEVIYKEVNSKLYFVKYRIKDSDEFVTIATTRPETILGDTAICIHPEDARYTHLHGKKALVPIINREIPIILDEYVSMEFGTGCLKVTPAHDLNDYELGQKHKLETIDTLNEDGTLSEAAQAPQYIGKDRFVVRKEIALELEALGHIVKIEDYKNQVGTSERTGAVIEPRISTQWFIAMKEFSKPALENVLNDEVQFHPTKFKNMYRSWMENVKDWCISRQLWWGHRIPAYYLPDGDFVVAKTPEEALQLAQEKNPNLQMEDLRQDEDVLDTWASSWLWPLQLFNGLENPENKEIKYYYPTSTLVTGFDIIFFWVARMIIAGYEYRQEKPFKNVYFTGMVRDKQRRKMSKSLGNSPDPIELMEQFSTDGVRSGILFSSPAGNDLLFDEKLCEQGRNFANKIWNSFRLIHGWEIDQGLTPQHETAITWFEAALNQAIIEMEAYYVDFRISDALMTIYKLFWTDAFCAWYLEIIKPEQGKGLDVQTYQKTIEFFEKLLKLLHPFMPFITEEIWQEIAERKEGDSISIASYPQAEAIPDKTILAEAEVVFEVITQIRNTRNAKQISPKVALDLKIKTQEKALFERFGTIIQKLSNIQNLDFVEDALEGAAGFLVKNHEFFIPIEGQIDVEKELEKLQKDLEYQKGFLMSVEKKLGNERFVSNAKPEVVEAEKQKKADAESKIKALEESISALSR
ncbi:MAG: valine--tRNA ligase [Microscillaceae bacterium]|nr:valine--tRNA ligase [Microscillaceae bacterium]